MFGIIKEEPKIIAVINDRTLYFAEISFTFRLFNINKTPINKERFTKPNSNKLIQLAMEKVLGNMAAIVFPEGLTPPKNSIKVNLKLFVNETQGEPGPIANHDKVKTKIGNTVTASSVKSNPGLTFEMTRKIPNISR